MSVQLIVYPQNYEGFSNSNNPSTQFLIDGINFTSVNASNNFFVAQPNGVQEAINFYNPTLPVNTWKRYSQGTSNVSVATNILTINVQTAFPQQGIIQKLSNLTVGGVYDITIDYSLLINGNNVLNLSTFTGSILQSSQPFPVNVSTNTIISFQFTANSTEDTIVIGGNSSTNGLINISNISIVAAPNQPSGAIQLLGDGQVILDLYEDEDLPLSLSVDDFKNIAEQVQSYSKAFNVPATKRNNRIFDHIFEVTREVESAGSLLFNPYKETKCVLKQDGFILFEGYLRMLDITDKEGETSYNVNLYSEVIALADLLQDRTFRDLDFTELSHVYDKTNIKRSWNDLGNSITYSNPSTSGFRDAYTTLRYPFVDWNHQFIIAPTGSTSATPGNPQLASLEQAFRPFINVKYIIDRIFEATDFTYESSFFNEDDFKKLYMDFNWGSAETPTITNVTNYNAQWAKQISGVTNPSVNAGTSFTNLVLFNTSNSTVPPNYDLATNIITATDDGEQYNLTGGYKIENTSTTATQTVDCQWIHNSIVVAQDTLTILPSSNQQFIFNITVILAQGDTLQAQFKRSNPSSSSTVRMFESGITPTSNVFFNVNTLAITTDVLLQTLRGELGQWEFLKGLITMFNLVSLPDENNPNNIKIEPYADVFITPALTTPPLNWTEKIDVSEMKLTPLTDLNRKTMFKFVEDEEDFAFTNYKNLVGGHLYGSLKYDAGNEFNILDGEKEIVAEPFAATVVKPLAGNYPQFITPSIYGMNEDGSTEGFENSPRIMYNNGIKPTGASYYIPPQNGLSSENQTNFLQFSHLSLIPSTSSAFDFHFGECQLIQEVGNPTAQNLFNLYWLPYYLELYNPNTRTMTIKVNLTPADINTFKFNDSVYLKNRVFRVNKIEYKPNDLATVEFILIP